MKKGRGSGVPWAQHYVVINAGPAGRESPAPWSEAVAFCFADAHVLSAHARLASVPLTGPGARFELATFGL